MKDKKWILGLVIVVLAIGVFSYFGFKKTEAGKTTPTVAGESTGTPVYYDDSAKVMEFYQDSCSWCIKENAVLERLGAEGYKVKPMNIGVNFPDHQSWWKDYNVSGTPTFIADNGKGERLEGYQDYDALKKFLDKNK